VKESSRHEMKRCGGVTISYLPDFIILKVNKQ
jgi:hypothetical protein